MARQTISVRLDVQVLDRLAAAADNEPDKPSRAELARRLIETGLARLAEAQRMRRRRAA